jgi:succinate dehydrogenase flavin-adding protein (antitoxin of CptAB toxin-antitoxin module)
MNNKNKIKFKSRKGIILELNFIYFILFFVRTTMNNKNKIKFKSRKGIILELNLILAQPLTKVDEFIFGSTFNKG